MFSKIFCGQLPGFPLVAGSDEAETLTFETKTSFKLRDRGFVKNSETETWNSRPRLQTLKFMGFAENFQKNIVTTSF